MAKGLLSRPFDCIIVLCLFVFVFISIFVEAPYCLGAEVSKDSKNIWMKWSYDWCIYADKLFIAKPLWVKYPLEHLNKFWLH
jgi:hypothetical protein